jgi:hypothetical protein
MALAAPSSGRAPLEAESLAAHYFTSVVSPLALDLRALLAQHQPADPAALAAAFLGGGPAWVGAARDPAAPAIGLAAALNLPAAIHPKADAATAARLARLLAAAPEQGSITAQALRDAMPEAERILAGRGMLWLLKTGFLRLVPG